MQIVDIDPGDPRLTKEVLPVLQELRPHLTTESFAALYDQAYPEGLRYTTVYIDDRCVAVAGWRLVNTTAVMKKLYVDDLVTTEKQRSTGAGRTLLAELRSRAQDAGCTALDLDSATWRKDAHRFYMREGLTIESFHFGLLLPRQ